MTESKPVTACPTCTEGWRRMDQPNCDKCLKGWQPIDTAPHGVRVLLGYWYRGEWVCEIAEASHGWTRNGISNMSRHGQAMFWMPLPGPPSFSQNGELKRIGEQREAD